MIQLYFTLVKQGRRTIDQVPERYRAEVQMMLDVEMDN
ncbi:CD1375 family protein [Syntrophomonas wolfei]|jgi:hypothetical protein|nr:CD1375 family protein [Syntrophomonas wolfei]